MSELILRVVLYIYPLWAFVAFCVGLAFLVDYLWNLDRRLPVFVTGIVHIGWALAFFGAGLLVAQVVNRAVVTPIIQSIWIVVFPPFAYCGAVKCLATWRALRHVDERRKKR